MRIAVIGSRTYAAPWKIDRLIDSLPPDTVVVSGGARGADTRAEERARHRGLTVDVIKPRWDIYGKQAGFVRNKAIVESCEQVWAFWDGRSPGTRDSIEHAFKLKIDVHVKFE